MKIIQLFINGAEADVYSYSDITPKIFKRTFNVENINQRGGDYTLDFKLPLTEKNKKILGFVVNIQNDNFSFLNNKYQIEIIKNGNTIFTGLMSIVKAFTDYIDVNIIGNNISFIDVIKDKTLNEIQSLKKIRYSGVKGSNISYSWPNNLPNTVSLYEIWQTDESAQDLQLPLVSYGNYPAPAGSSIENFRGFANQFYLYNKQDYSLDWSRFYPAVYERSIIRGIFEDMGYSVSGDYFTNDDFKNILDLYTNKDNQEPVWNWGIMGRVDVEVFYNNLSLTTKSHHTFNVQDNNTRVTDAMFGNLINATNTLNTPYIGNEILHFFRFNLNEDDFNLTDAPDVLPSTDIFNEYERYAYDTCFKRVENGAVNNQYDNSYRVLADGIYNITATIEGFGIFDIPGNSTTTWANAGNNNGLTFMLVKRNSKSFAGDSNDGLWKLSSAQIGSGLSFNDYDSQVIAFEFLNSAQVQALINNSTTITIQSSIVQELKKGDIIELVCGIYFKNAALPLGPLNIGDNLYTINNSIPFWQTFSMDNSGSIRLTVTNTLSQELDPADNLRSDIKQIEYLKSIINSYNLFLDVDDTKKSVSINTFKNYFYSVSAAKDWSDKCNLKNATYYTINNISKINFKHTEDENDIIWNESFIEPDYEYNLDNKVDNIKEIEVLHLPIVNKLFIIGNPDLTNENISYYLPTMSDRETQAAKLVDLDEGSVIPSFDFVLRKAVWKGLINTGYNGGLWVEDLLLSSAFLSPGNNYFVIPTCYFYDVNYSFLPSTQTKVLQFNNYVTNTINIQGNFTTYWSNYIENIISKNVLLELPIMLSDYDMQTFNNRYIIIIENQQFIINLINGYDIINDIPTRVILLKK